MALGLIAANAVHPRVWPTPLPDETLFSVAAQHNLLTVSPTASETFRVLFNSHSVSLACGFPTHLRTLARYLEPVCPTWTEGRLIQQFTYLPYIRFFYAKSVVEKVADLVLGTDGRSIKTLLGWVASRIGAADPLRCCPACYGEDYRIHGRPYWHRAHQLPGVLACHIHRINLTQILGPAEGYGRFLLYPPPAPMSAACCASATPFSLRIADWSNSLLNSHSPEISPENLKSLYLHRLAELGFITKAGHVRQREFHTWIRRNFDVQSECAMGREIQIGEGTVNLDWASKIVRKPRNAQHPLKHIVLLSLLFDTATSLQALQYRGQKALVSLINRNIEKAETQVDLSQVPFRSLRALSKEVGLSVNTLAVEMTRRGRPIKRRPKVLTDDRVRAIRTALEKGGDLKKIGSTFAVSSTTMYRVLRSYPETCRRRSDCLAQRELQHRRIQITKWIDKHPKASRSEILTQCAGATAWLRRHDKAWLQNVLAHCKTAIHSHTTCVDWPARDCQLLKLLQTAYAHSLAADGKPQRITRVSLAREVQKIPWVQKHIDHLPLSGEFLQSHVDSSQSFHRRRLQWALHEVAIKKLPLTLSNIIRLAGIRRPEQILLDDLFSLSCEVSPVSTA